MLASLEEDIVRHSPPHSWVKRLGDGNAEKKIFEPRACSCVQRAPGLQLSWTVTQLCSANMPFFLLESLLLLVCNPNKTALSHQIKHV